MDRAEYYFVNIIGVGSNPTQTTYNIIFEILMYVCPVCALNPGSHSLSKLYEKENIVYYYTCPGKALLYNDTIGIMNHYEGVIREINCPWIWVFDGTGFGLAHSLEVNIGIQIAGIMANYSDLLQKIIVINPSAYVSTIYTVLYPFLNKKMKEIIEFKESI